LRFINTVMWFALVLLTACAPHKTAPKGGNFPVVVPFALDRKGSTVTVEFELPDARDPYLEASALRPVFIGVRWTYKDGDLMTEAESKTWDRQYDYLSREQIPVRLVLQRWEQGKWQLAAMQEEHDNIERSTGRVWYEPIAADGIVPGLTPADPDHMELAAIGQDQEDKAYATFEWVRIVPPTPGRYRLRVESLQEHSDIRGLTFELLVSHNYHYGIR
jgi:hypothetical protein